MIEQLQKIEPQRDQLGCWIHPAFYHFYEQIAQGADGLTKTQMEQLEKLIGHKISITEIFEQLSEKDAVRLEKGDMDVVSEWQPKPPNDKAFLVSIHDTDDGTVAWWATPQTINDKCVGIEKARQEMKRQAFEKLPEVADSLSEHIVFIGNKYTTPNQGFYDLVNWLNGAWYAWQAAQEQVLQGQWISVIDQLPPSGEMVLICWADNPEIEPEKDFMDVCVDTANKYWSNFGDDQPTHWQPLPQPPKQ